MRLLLLALSVPVWCLGQQTTNAPEPRETPSTLGHRATFFLHDTNRWDITYPQAGDARGGGEAWGNEVDLHCNVPGRSVGNGANVAGSAWFTCHGLDLLVTMDNAGITEGIKLSVQKNAVIGDTSVYRNFVSYKPGGATAASDENFKFFYAAINPIASYKGTVKPNAANVTGSRDVYTRSLNGGCGAYGNNRGEGICSGGGGYLLNTSANGLVYSGHATKIVVPKGNSPGTMTVDYTAIPSPAYASIAAGVPDNRATYGVGDTVTLPLTNIVGKIPPRGNAVISAAAGSVAEEVGYTYNAAASTITISGHSFPHGVNGSIFFNSLRFMTFTQDTADNGGSASVYLILGAYDAHTLAWASYRTGARGCGSICTGASSIAEGTGPRAAHHVYQGALVLHVQDPGVVPDTNSYYSEANTGYFRLGPNTAPWNPGDTVEQPYEPAVSFRGFDLSFGKNIADTGVVSVAHRETMTANIPFWTQLILANNLDVVSRRGSMNVLDVKPLSASAGTFNNLIQMEVAPTGAMIAVYGCAAGDPTRTCTGTPDILLLNDVKTGNGPVQISYNKSAAAVKIRADGGVSFSNAISARRVQLTSTTDTCNAATDGSFRFVAGGKGVKDSLSICAKDANDTYAYRTIF